MKSVRLLPVVIFAALALLLFKGVGLLTNGGYILTGPSAVQAAGGGEAPAVADGAMPSDVVLTDTSPVLDDTAPTLATKAEVPAVHAPAENAEGASETSHDAGSGPSHDEQVSHDEVAAEPEIECPTSPEPSASSDGGHGPTDNIGSALAMGCAPVEIALNEHGDALPLVRDEAGKIVLLEAAGGDNSEDALLGRLSERRVALDRLEADIAMRSVLLEAAEQRLEARTRELGELEARVAALVDEKQVAEEAGFKAVVSMYEGMKPKDAAKIFDTLSMPVMLKVARAMSPRKMSPILAAMSPEPAQKLTTAMAATESTDVVADASENLAQLPQIVGR